MNPKLTAGQRKARAILSRFQAAAIASAWMGSRPTAEWPAIEAEYQAAKRDLEIALGLAVAP